MPFHRLSAALPLVLVLGLAACGDDDARCPAGLVPEGGRCVAQKDAGPIQGEIGDASPPSDGDTMAADDASADAHLPLDAETCQPSGEVCGNGEDDDCDGETDEGCNCTEDMPCGTAVGACVEGTRRCDGGRLGECEGATLPADETCNGADDDCDGETDEGVLRTFYADADQDGFGVGSACMACAAEDCGSGAWATDTGDCDDGCGSCFPGGTEICDVADNDCDSRTDEGVQDTFYRDADGDGYGLTGEQRLACTRPSGYASVDGDCDDRDEDAFPTQTEFHGEPAVGGGYDYDCDGEITWELRAEAGEPREICAFSSCSSTFRYNTASLPPCGTTSESFSCPSLGGRCSAITDSRLVRCR